jgi:hypothetical protein
MTPEERAAMGLPEKGWEEKVWDGLDLGRIKHPTPGYAERRRTKTAVAAGAEEELSDPNAEFRRRLAVYGMSEEQRRETRLPDKGWRDALWEGFDFSGVTAEIPMWLRSRARRQGWKG